MLTILFIAAFSTAQAPGEQVAFLHQVNDDSRLVCLLEVMSGDVRTLGGGPWDGAPVWSPDGAMLAFTESTNQGHSAIRVVSGDGAPGPAVPLRYPFNRFPAWSPDGKKLAYSSGDDQACRIRVFDLTTNEETEWGALDSSGDAEGRQNVAFLQPIWRSSTAIAAVGIRDDKEGRTADLYQIEQDEVTLFVETRGSGSYVEWNPAAHVRTEKFAYETNDGGDREIFVYTRQRGAIDVSNHRTADWNPVWSPDGAWLAFESFRGGTRGIYKVMPQRTIVTPIVVDASCDHWSPAWSPDGEWIVFVSMRTGKPTLHACRSDGSDARALTKHDGDDFAPAWRPVKTK